MFEYVLTFGNCNMFQAHLCILLPWICNQPFLQEPCFYTAKWRLLFPLLSSPFLTGALLIGEIKFRTQDLGPRCVDYYSVITPLWFLLGPLSADLGNTHTHIHTHLSISIVNYLLKTVSSYWYLLNTRVHSASAVVYL